MVALDDAVADRQAQPGTRKAAVDVGAVETAEHGVVLLGGDAQPAVGDLHNHPVVLSGVGGDIDPRCLAGCGVFEALPMRLCSSCRTRAGSACTAGNAAM